MRFSKGASGKPGAVNSPTVYNTSNNFVFFWDGRAGSLEDQIDGPVHNPDEMDSNWGYIIEFLKNNPEYKEAFAAIYGAEPSETLVKDVIVEFEKSLVTPDSPFDQYLKGDKSAISEQAKQGYILFKKYGCASCHNGQNVGGTMYQQFGVIGNYFEDRGNITEADLGRYNVTGDEYDKHVFKVSSLRNVNETAPYFHDGSVQTLEGAIEVMAKYQVGVEMSKEEINQIAEFLKTLTGQYQGKNINRMRDE